MLWAEWNGKYRDCIRAYWKGDMGQLGEFAYRLTGSSDLYESDGRRPYASINLITAHDGFTLYDTVAYNEKHNEANGENNQDGHNDNRSWNCGAEGPTDDEAINNLRRRQIRNFLTTMFLSQGVPMLVGGDEFGRTQNGNNNAYCQDNELSWFNWDMQDWQKEMIEFTSKLIGVVRKHPVFRRPKWFHGRKIRGSGLKDIMWFGTGGSEMTEEDWTSGFVRCLGMMLSGDTMDVRDEFGEPIKDDTFLLLFNAHHEPVNFALAGKEDVEWESYLDTRYESGFAPEATKYKAGDEIDLVERSMCVVRLHKGSQENARTVSWKHKQKAEPTAPPVPPTSSKNEPIDPTTAGTRKRRSEPAKPKTITELAQGAKEEKEPPIK